MWMSMSRATAATLRCCPASVAVSEGRVTVTAVLDHPAVPIAVGVVREFGAIAPVDLLVRENMAAVLLEGEDKRFVVFVANGGGQWVAPGMTGGSPRRMREQQEPRTGQVPLTGVARRATSAGTAGSGSWLAVTGQAAADAVAVSVATSMDSVRVPVGSNGLVFALVRGTAPTAVGDRPQFETVDLVVHTRDGRSVPTRV